MLDRKQYIDCITKFPTAWRGHGEFAMNLVELLKPETVVDLGVDYGFSTFCFAYPKIGDVYGIDWFKGDNNAGHRDTFELVAKTYLTIQVTAGVLNIQFIKSDFDEAAKLWQKPIDILHIDGFHSYEAVSNDFEKWSKFCHKKSVILLHDTQSYPLTVGKFFNELKGFKYEKLDWFGLGIYTQDEEIFKKVQSIL
jgi:hypothetical protein